MSLLFVCGSFFRVRLPQKRYVAETVLKLRVIRGGQKRFWTELSGRQHISFDYKGNLSFRGSDRKTRP